MSARGKPVSRGIGALRLDGEDVAADNVAHDRAAALVITLGPTVGVDVTVQEQRRLEPIHETGQGVEADVSRVGGVVAPARWCVGQHDVDGVTVAPLTPAGGDEQPGRPPPLLALGVLVGPIAVAHRTTEAGHAETGPSRATTTRPRCT